MEDQKKKTISFEVTIDQIYYAFKKPKWHWHIKEQKGRHFSSSTKRYKDSPDSAEDAARDLIKFLPAYLAEAVASDGSTLG